MNRTQLSTTCRTARRGATVKILASACALGAIMVASALAVVIVPSAQAGDMYRPAAAPGGIQISPSLGTPIPSGTTNVILPYEGLQAPYEVQMSTDLGSTWTSVAYTTIQHPGYANRVLVTNVPTSSQFRLRMLGLTNWAGRHVVYTNFAGVSNTFMGALKCDGCHSDKVAKWSQTPHATAVNQLIDTNGVFKPIQFGTECIACHSVGWKQAGGFTGLTTTPQLASVGCEACHGPANSHLDISSRLYRPVATLAPEVCGGCHTGSHHPTYDEYLTSGHREVSIDVSYGVASGNFNPGTLVTNGTTWYGYIENTNGTFSPAAGIYNSLSNLSGITAGYGRGMSCGPCHSGAYRAAMLADYEARQTGVTNYLHLPTKTDGADWGPTCVTCHDPHAMDRAAQVRNPLRSTNYYTFFTGSILVTNRSTNVSWSTNIYTYINGVDMVATPGPLVTNIGNYIDYPWITYTNVTRMATNVSTDIYYMNNVFAAQYDPNIQICAQCHNSRGARWDGRSKSWNAASNAMVLGTSQSFSRPPHHSPQYNVLIGIAQDDYLSRVTHSHTGTSATSGASNQCATCHVPSYSVSSSTNVTGHSFAMDVKSCALAGCHTSYSLDGLHFKIEERQVNASNSIARVVNMLNQWALTKAPDVLRTNYGTLGWEYGAPGVLGNPTGASVTGPTTAHQASIPDAIKKARFNLYMVQHDGSMGVHNPSYSDYLVRDAETNVTSQFPSANFRAISTAGYAPFTVAFTNLGGTLGSYGWDFGDGVGISTSANPSYTYTNPGIYTVTFTANGTETMTRTAYIRAVTKPVVSFNADQTTVAVGTPVTFTNTSTSISDVGLWRWTFNLTNSSTRLDSGFTPTATYTYTNAGTFSVSLRASTPGGSITTTNAAYITVTNAP